MARISSTWWRPPSLNYRPSMREVKRKDHAYRKWLANQRLWSESQVDDYLRSQKKEDNDDRR
jgi:hypothetical protein